VRRPRDLGRRQQRRGLHRGGGVDDLPRRVEDLREVLAAAGERAGLRGREARVGLLDERGHVARTRPQALPDRGVELGAEPAVEEESRSGRHDRHHGAEGERDADADWKASDEEHAGRAPRMEAGAGGEMSAAMGSGWGRRRQAAAVTAAAIATPITVSRTVLPR
jgi:hypothetical protein